MGVDFDERNALFDESLEVLRKTWKGGSVVYKGRHFNAVGNTANPTPAQPEIPIWIGGNSQLTRRRVAEGCQGWMPMPNPRSLGGRRRTAHIDGIDDLRAGIAYMKEHAKKVGRTAPIDIFFPVMVGGAVGTPKFDLTAYREHVDVLRSQRRYRLQCPTDGAERGGGHKNARPIQFEDQRELQFIIVER